MNVFIANIGNRDVAINCGTGKAPNFVTFSKQQRAESKEVQEFLKCEPGTRAMVAALSERFPDRRMLLSMLRFPILRPALKCSLSHCSDTGGLDRIVLVATDQDPEKARYHHSWDTIGAARLLRELLPLDSELGPHLRDVPIKPFPITSSPHRFETAYQLTGGLFQNFSGSDVNVYASMNGGIPGLNSALRVHVLNKYGPRAHLIETDEPSEEQKQHGEEGQASFADSWPYRRDALLRITRDLLDAHEYQGLLDVLRRELSDDEVEYFVPVFVLLRHAAARFNLDFENAEGILRKAVSKGDLSNQKAKLYSETVERGPLSLQRLHEILGTVRILLNRGDYSNLVIRTAILTEAVRRQLFSLLADVPKSSDIRPRHLNDQLVKTLRQNKRVRRSQRDGTYHVNMPFLITGINWGMKRLTDGPAKEAAEGAQNRLDNLRKVKDMRHDVIHRAEGTSQADIERYFTKVTGLVTILEGLLNEMEQLHTELDVAPQITADVYSMLNEAVLDHLSA